MKKRNMTPTIYAPTLVDADAHRRIIPKKDAPALCGAVGEQDAPRDHKTDTLCHKTDTLCLRCRQKYMRGVLGERLKGFGL